MEESRHWLGSEQLCGQLRDNENKTASAQAGGLGAALVLSRPPNAQLVCRSGGASGDHETRHTHQGLRDKTHNQWLWVTKKSCGGTSQRAQLPRALPCVAFEQTSGYAVWHMPTMRLDLSRPLLESLTGKR